MMSPLTRLDAGSCRTYPAFTRRAHSIALFGLLSRALKVVGDFAAWMRQPFVAADAA